MPPKINLSLYAAFPITNVSILQPQAPNLTKDSVRSGSVASAIPYRTEWINTEISLYANNFAAYKKLTHPCHDKSEL